MGGGRIGGDQSSHLSQGVKATLLRLCREASTHRGAGASPQSEQGVAERAEKSLCSFEIFTFSSSVSGHYNSCKQKLYKYSNVHKYLSQHCD